MNRIARRISVGLAAIVLASCSGAPVSGSSPGPTASPQTTLSPLPSPTASPSPSLPSGFACADASGGSTLSGSRVTAVRVGAHPDLGYDRFVLEFDGTIPGFTVARQDTSEFTQSPKGSQVTLAGDHGVLVTIQPVQDWSSYAGPADFGETGRFLLQSKLIQNFEGVQQWALGVRGASCLDVTTMSSPSRLVIDIAAG